MAYLDPDEAAAIAHGCWVVDRPESDLTSFAIDTRLLQAGETFVALKTARADGHAFLRKARQFRARAALVEQPDREVALPQLVVRNSLVALQELARAWRDRFTAPVIGVTGSFGKTTVKEMLGTVLGSQWFRTRGNYNNHIGVPLSLLELDPRHHAGAIIEAGINDTGEMEPLAGMIRPGMAIITAVGPAHLERLGTLAGVAREKALLGRAVPPGGDVFIPAQVLAHEAFRALAGPVRLHALAGPGDRVDPAWGRLENVTIYHYKWTETTGSRGMGELVTEPPMLPGKFAFRAGSPGMVSNLALVVHASLHLGVPVSTIQSRLAAWQPFRQRGEIRQHGPTTYYVDCYNANPGSMLDSARRFRSLYAGRAHCYVLGGMNELGGESALWHRKTGASLPVQEGADVFLYGEGSLDLAEGLRSQGVAAERIHVVGDLEEIRGKLDGFQGAVFLKGSRSHGLESLVPTGGGSPC